ncbi:MAG: (Fe-S)-binding protein [Calditrichaeota bacterium]|nr:MAG: (Fe-S)-binding protein [Calditrichota bacterium]MBL1207114.1 (Fe-S)-binding protein [Calditrichota bacterium]NOG46944.1 (Fe-S)-binding protein [Calditrichota bacterium]
MTHTHQETKNSTNKSTLFSKIPVPDYEQILNCMHCGMCLPSCPTYEMTGLEKYSPRGRIRMIKAVADGELSITENYIESLDFCLDCQACVTACPAGVEYGKLVEAAHNQISEHQKQNGKNSFKTLILNKLFEKQSRLLSIAFFLKLYQKSGLEFLVQKSKILFLISKKLHNLSFMVPKVPEYKKYEFYTKNQQSTLKGKVGVITGCVQDAFFNNVNHDTIEVLAYNGYEVITPKSQQCCGSVSGHNGELDSARHQAKKIIDQFYTENVDNIIINSAGCGSYMKEYHTLLEDDPIYAEKAIWFSDRVKDISEFLVDQGFIKPVLNRKMIVTYHEPCHLVHGQKISKQPREIIEALPGVEFIEMEESDWCCGSAGIYNITHYDHSMILLERKFDKLKKTKADYVVSGNPGCMIQLAYGNHKFNSDFKILHPVSLLNNFYKGGEDA